MKAPLPLTAMLLLSFLPTPSGAFVRGDELHLDPAHYSELRARFGSYGHRPRQSIFQEPSGFRFRLPEQGVPQTGLYSYFALAGDCEVTLSYELLNVPLPRGGYGSGVGLAFDLAGDGRGVIQRLIRPGEGNGYVLQIVPGEHDRDRKEVDRFVPAETTHGRIGLRRVKNELIFLKADTSDSSLQEIDRLPFTERTIRAVRVFADPGGSPTALDVRVSAIEIHAAEIASGVPRSEETGWSWGWLWPLVVAVGGTLLFWVWRAQRRNGKSLR
jgi:hypothetical protein